MIAKTIGEFIQHPDHGLMYRTSQNEPFRPYKPRMIDARAIYKWSDYREVNGNMSTIKSKKIQCQKCNKMFAPGKMNSFKGENICMGCLIPESEQDFVDQGREEYYRNSAGVKSGMDCSVVGVKLRSV